jgi:hypothetical protein
MVSDRGVENDGVNGSGSGSEISVYATRISCRNRVLSLDYGSSRHGLEDEASATKSESDDEKIVGRSTTRPSGSGSESGGTFPSSS